MSDMDGIGFLKYLRSIGNATPVILYSHNGANNFGLSEVNNGIEITVSRSVDIRSSIAELVTLLKQTTLRRKSERDIKLQNDQLTTILSATPLGIFQMRNDTIEWVNRPLAALLGYPENHLVGKPVQILFKTPEEYRTGHPGSPNPPGCTGDRSCGMRSASPRWQRGDLHPPVTIRRSPRCTNGWHNCRDRYHR